MNYPSCTCCSDLIAVRVEHEMLIAQRDAAVAELSRERVGREISIRQVDAVLAELIRTRAELSDIANALRPPAA